MPSIDRFLAEIFDYAPAAPLSLDEEREAIHDAKAGDEPATLRLLRAYAPAMRSTFARYRKAIDADELRAEILATFLAAVQEFDPEKGDRLAGTIGDRLTRGVGSAVAAAPAFSIPERTLQRFYGILRRAAGDASRAAEIAPRYEMTRENFLSILAVVRQSESLDGDFDTAEIRSGEARSLWGEGTRFEADAEDAILCEAAFRAVDAQEKDVVGLAYGFSDYDPIPDAEIGHRLGLSRPKTQRVRAGALGKMREALAVA